jgi:O-antigen ligase
MFLDRPLLGFGIGNFSVAHAMRYSPPDYQSWLQAHNLVAQVAGETGLLGLIAFAGFVIASMRLAGRLSGPPRPVPVSLLGGMASRANPPPSAAVSLAGSDDASFVASVARATLASFWLLLFLGLFSHNVLRFNWYVNAGLVSACALMLPSVLARHENREPGRV